MLQQRMVVDGVAQLHGVLDLALHHLDALPRDLAAAEVQGGPVRFQRRQLVQQVAGGGRIAFLELRCARPVEPVGGFFQAAPGIGTQLPDGVVCVRLVHGPLPCRWVSARSQWLSPQGGSGA